MCNMLGFRMQCFGDPLTQLLYRDAGKCVGMKTHGCMHTKSLLCVYGPLKNDGLNSPIPFSRPGWIPMLSMLMMALVSTQWRFFLWKSRTFNGKGSGQQQGWPSRMIDGWLLRFVNKQANFCNYADWQQGLIWQVALCMLYCGEVCPGIRSVGSVQCTQYWNKSKCVPFLKKSGAGECSQFKCVRKISNELQNGESITDAIPR